MDGGGDELSDKESFRVSIGVSSHPGKEWTWFNRNAKTRGKNVGKVNDETEQAANLKMWFVALNRAPLDDQFDIELTTYRRVDQKTLHHAVCKWILKRCAG